jgi:hypothetical protein
MITAAQFDFDFDRAPLRDTTRRKHRGNLESEAANRRMHPWKAADCAMLEQMIRQSGAEGITSEEIACRLGTPGYPAPKNTFSGRLTELKDAQLIYVVGTRERCGILVHREYMGGMT